MKNKMNILVLSGLAISFLTEAFSFFYSERMYGMMSLNTSFSNWLFVLHLIYAFTLGALFSYEKFKIAPIIIISISLLKGIVLNPLKLYSYQIFMIDSFICSSILLITLIIFNHEFIVKEQKDNVN